MKSICDNAASCNSIERTAAGGLLDIHRDNPTGQRLEAAAVSDDREKITKKVTPDMQFSPAEKKAWRQQQDKRLALLEGAARSIVLDYVNSDTLQPDEVLLPDNEEDAAVARAAYLEERREIRRGQFRSFLKCLRKNGHGPADLVLYDDNTVRIAGVWHCGSLWQCPRCSSSGLYRYSRRLVDVLLAVQSENAKRRKVGFPCLSVLFGTFTAPHTPGESLADQMGLFSGVWSSVMDSRPVRRLRAKYGLVGYVRCYDHTLTFRNGQRDWHTHFHNLLIFDPVPRIAPEEAAAVLGPEIADGSPEAAEVFDVLFAVWKNRIAKKAGGRECSDKAFHIEIVDLEDDSRSDKAVADYAAKVLTLPGYLTKSQKMRAGEEVAPGAPFKSLAPFDILDAYLEHGGAVAPYDYAGAWIEYCIATKGFHRVHFSRGLEESLGIARKKDCNKEARPVCRHELPGAVADVALRDCVVLDGLRDAVVADDVVLYFDVLESVGLERFADDVAESKPMQERQLPESVAVRARFRMERGESIADLLEDWDGVA